MQYDVLPRSSGTIFQQGVKVKHQVSSCNMIRWFTHHQPLKSCWLLDRWSLLLYDISVYMRSSHENLKAISSWISVNWCGRWTDTMSVFYTLSILSVFLGLSYHCNFCFWRIKDAHYFDTCLGQAPSEADSKGWGRPPPIGPYFFKKPLL